jgi:putative acetyltransferase
MIRIQRESVVRADVSGLLAQSDDLMTMLYPAESNHLLDVTALDRPEATFYVARLNDRAIGCSAWLRTGDQEAELKRMFVLPDYRGQKIGRLILETIEADAFAAGVRVIYLETGVKQPEALSLYRTHGYTECAPFPPYGPDPLSVFLVKRLA